ncbi:hypothetical protein [Nonomuraea sp. NEAU-A123]|uniref:hypothetical protein n=1 Tax=Nonomuraea sp. NEAU-A123 TaxID=2839649 RepID=UPI001BE4507F|nr:hypothetical protein [Nonomuraea sp. NEAU-A123]MBT2229955.1 hypothetical protein [Nonomuraea sp. NEAU-A123]
MPITAQRTEYGVIATTPLTTTPTRAPRTLPLLLLRPLVRAISWAPLAVVTLFTAALVTLADFGQPLTAGMGLILLRISGTLLGSAAAFALVDAMSGGAEPVSHRLRQAERCLLAGGVAVAVWLGAFAYVLSRLPDGALFPVGDMLVEVGVCLGIGLAAAATAVRYAPGRQAAMAAVVVQLALVLATILLPPEVRLWPPTCGFGYWDEAHRFWLFALPVPYLWLVVSGRDLR